MRCQNCGTLPDPNLGGQGWYALTETVNYCPSCKPVAWGRCKDCDLGWVLLPGADVRLRESWDRCGTCCGEGYVGTNRPPGPDRPPIGPPPTRRMYS